MNIRVLLLGFISYFGALALENKTNLGRTGKGTKLLIVVINIYKLISAFVDAASEWMR